MILDKLQQEEKELEELVYGKKQENQEDNTSPLEINPDTTPIVQEERKEEDDGSSWKKRFTSFKASADNTIFQLRKDNAQLKSDIANVIDRNETILSEVVALKKQISTKSQEDSYDNLFSQEEVDIIGPEAVDIFKKVVKKTAGKPKEENEDIKLLKEELNLLKKERNNNLRKEKENIETESFGSLKTSLEKIVPDWQSIDVDPKFLSFLEEADEFSGLPKRNLFASAVQSRDVFNVSRFYNEFKGLRSSKEDILSKKVTPIGTNSGSSDNLDKESNSKKTYTINEFNKFMDDYTKGKYKGKEKEARIIEARFDKAFIEGRIID